MMFFFLQVKKKHPCFGTFEGVPFKRGPFFVPFFFFWGEVNGAFPKQPLPPKDETIGPIRNPFQISSGTSDAEEKRHKKRVGNAGLFPGLSYGDKKRFGVEETGWDERMFFLLLGRLTVDGRNPAPPGMYRIIKPCR